MTSERASCNIQFIPPLLSFQPVIFQLSYLAIKALLIIPRHQNIWGWRWSRTLRGLRCQKIHQDLLQEVHLQEPREWEAWSPNTTTIIRLQRRRTRNSSALPANLQGQHRLNSCRYLVGNLSTHSHSPVQSPRSDQTPLQRRLSSCRARNPNVSVNISVGQIFNNEWSVSQS